MKKGRLFQHKIYTYRHPDSAGFTLKELSHTKFDGSVVVPFKMYDLLYIGIDPSIIRGGFTVQTPEGKIVLTGWHEFAVLKEWKTDERIEILSQYARYMKDIVLTMGSRYCGTIEDNFTVPGKSNPHSVKVLAAAQATWRAIFYEIPISLADPRAWKRQVGMTRDKNDSREFARLIYSDVQVDNHDQAESIHICNYGRVNHKKSLLIYNLTK